MTSSLPNLDASKSDLDKLSDRLGKCFSFSLFFYVKCVSRSTISSSVNSKALLPKVRINRVNCDVFRPDREKTDHHAKRFMFATRTYTFWVSNEKFTKIKLGLLKCSSVSDSWQNWHQGRLLFPHNRKKVKNIFAIFQVNSNQWQVDYPNPKLVLNLRISWHNWPSQK